VQVFRIGADEPGCADFAQKRIAVFRVEPERQIDPTEHRSRAVVADGVAGIDQPTEVGDDSSSPAREPREQQGAVADTASGPHRRDPRSELKPVCERVPLIVAEIGEAELRAAAAARTMLRERAPLPIRQLAILSAR
jgi:hypothetical protein